MANGSLGDQCVAKYKALPPHVGWLLLGLLVSLICGVIFLVGDEDVPADCLWVNVTTGLGLCSLGNVTGWGCPHRLFSHDPELLHGPHGKTEVVCTNQKSTEAFLVCLAGAVFAAACALQALRVWERTPPAEGAQARGNNLMIQDAPRPEPVPRTGWLDGMGARVAWARHSLYARWMAWRRGPATSGELTELLNLAFRPGDVEGEGPVEGGYGAV